MVYLAGVPVRDDAAAWLIVRLLGDDDEDAATAARAIDKALHHGMRLLALSKGERDAILAVLDDPPEGLVELRGRLLSEPPG